MGGTKECQEVALSRGRAVANLDCAVQGKGHWGSWDGPCYK